MTGSDTRHICPLSWGVVPEPQIFLNYRRSNAEWRADRLYDALADEFGEEQVFKDTDTIAAGTEYALVIQQALTRTDVVVALIGPAWSDIRDAGGGRRLDDPSDLVRHELEVALERRGPILPVLVNEATRPVADELPERLRGLAAKQALTLNDATWRATVKGELLARVRELHEEMRARRREAAAIGVGGVFGSCWRSPRGRKKRTAASTTRPTRSRRSTIRTSCPSSTVSSTVGATSPAPSQ